MRKVHNQGKTNDADPENKTPGQDRHRSNKYKVRKNDKEVRSPKQDPSRGTKGQNSIS